MTKKHGSTDAKKHGSTALVAGERTLVPWINIHWFDERNTRVEWGKVSSDLGEAIRALKPEERDEDRKRTVDGLVIPMLHGWDDLKQGFVECTSPTDDEISKAIDERRQKIDALRADTEAPEVVRAVADWLERFWFPDGEPADVLAIGNMAYRRGRSLPYVTYARQRRGIGIPGDYAVPVLLKVYADAKAEFLRHIGENLGKDEGRKAYSALDFAMIARRLLSYPDAKQADLLNQGAKKGQAQKAWYFAKLDQQYPKLHLYERVMLQPSKLVDGKYLHWAPGSNDPEGKPDERGCYIPYEMFPHQWLANLLDGKQPDAKASAAQPIKTYIDGRHVEEFVKQTLAGKNAKRALTTAELSAVLGITHGLELIRIYAKAVTTGNKAVIIELAGETAYNDVKIDAEKYDNLFNAVNE